MHSPHILIVVGLWAGFASSSTHAQSLVYAQNGQLQGGSFGSACDAAGQIDGDGIPDFVGGADRTTPNQSFAGTGTAHSGASGNVIYEYNGTTAFQFLGESVAGVGDVNNDGRDDFAICTSNEDIGGSDTGRARIYSGATGALIYSFVGANPGDGLGFSVDGAGFINGDARPDIIVGAPGDDTGGNAAGAAFVFSGSNGSVIHTLIGPVPGGEFGATVCKAGDVDDDGRDDFMVGSPFEVGATTRGRVTVYSGADASVIHTFLGSSTDFAFGTSLAAPGDLNQDGHADLVVGASSATVNGITGGAAYVFSGADGSLLFTHGADNGGDSLGEGMGDGGDVDGDGVGDYVIGVPRSDENGISSGHVRVISGATNSELFRVLGGQSNERFGTSCAILGDASGNGSEDVLVGAPGAALQRGRCYVYQYDGSGGGPLTYCSSKTSSAGCVTQIGTTAAGAQPISGGSDYSVTAAQVQEGKNGLLFAGTAGPATIPFSGGILCVQPPTKRGPIVFSGGNNPAECDGSFGTLVNDGAVIPVGLDAGPGNSAWYQYWYRDPMNGPGDLGTALSDAIQLDFQ